MVNHTQSLLDFGENQYTALPNNLLLLDIIFKWRSKLMKSVNELLRFFIKIIPINTNDEFHILDSWVKLIVKVSISDDSDCTITVTISWCINQKDFFTLIIKKLVPFNSTSLIWTSKKFGIIVYEFSWLPILAYW